MGNDQEEFRGWIHRKTGHCLVDEFDKSVEKEPLLHMQIFLSSHGRNCQHLSLTCRISLENGNFFVLPRVEISIVAKF